MADNTKTPNPGDKSTQKPGGTDKKPSSDKPGPSTNR